jgi:hypothetical protein
LNHYAFNEKFRELVREERLKTNEVLRMINEFAKSKGYYSLGHSSLFDWLVRGHGYSESAAYRRIEAARVIAELPEISNQLESGEVSLTQVAKVQSAVRAQERATKSKISTTAKSAAIKAIGGKPRLQAELTLMDLFPAAQATASLDRTHVVNNETFRISFNVSKVIFDDLTRAKEILSHAIPSGAHSEILARLLKEFLNRRDPLRKDPRTTGVGAPAIQ